MNRVIKDAQGNNLKEIYNDRNGFSMWERLHERGELSAKSLMEDYSRYAIELHSEHVRFVSNIKEDITTIELIRIDALVSRFTLFEHTAESVKQTMKDLGILRHFDIIDCTKYE